MTSVTMLVALVAAVAGPSDSGVKVRNPEFIRAAAPLTRREPGQAPRVRFEWERVPGATAYLLTGSWADREAWTVAQREYRVTARVATTWTREGIAFELSLPPGTHSWRVVALFSPNDRGDFDHPSRIAFDLE